MLRITPKSFDAVDMVSAAIRKGLAMIQAIVFAKPFERIIASECIGVVYRSFSGMRANVGHKFISSHLLHNLGVYSPVALQKAKNNAFSCCSPSALAFAPAAEVGLVNFNFSLQFASFKLDNMIDGFAQMLIHAANRLVVHAKVSGNTISRLLLVKTGENRNLFAELFQRFLLLALSAFYIVAARLADRERTAKNALSAPQKVGRTAENVLFLHNHKDILAPHGYETH